MKRLLIVKNCAREGPGLFEKILSDHSVAFEIIDLDRGERLPTFNDFRALLVLGGPDSANDATPKIKGLLQQIHEALGAGIPYLGVCLGLQLLVKAAGGTVVKNRIREIGFRDPDGDFYRVDLTAEGQSDPLLAGMETSFPVFQLHGETVVLTGEDRLLGTGATCVNQVVRAGRRAYGIQGHLELTGPLLTRWMAEDPDLSHLSAADLQKDFTLLRDQIERSGEILFGNFLSLVGLSSPENRISPN